MRVILAILSSSIVLCGCGGGATATPSNASTEQQTGAVTGGSTAANSAGPRLLQYATYQTLDAAAENDSQVLLKAPAQAGDTLWVAVTLSDYAGVHTISVSDTEGNEFIALDQENDGPPGSQTVAHFYAANIAGDTGTPDAITINWSQENYKGVLAAEIGGVSTAPLVAHSAGLQDGLAAGTANVTSGAMAVGSGATPALLIALSMNTSGGSSDTGGSGAPGPAASSGFTQIAQLWDWGTNLATLETVIDPTPGEISATYDAASQDSYVTVAAVFK